MGDSTGISWTDHTFNPWWGCARVSPACRFCYADTLATRWGHQLWRRHGERRMMSDRAWGRPLIWNRDAERLGVPARTFCASMADVFEDHPQVAEPRKRLWDVIEQTPWLRWQLLTKRIENVAGMVPWGNSWPANVWIGTSVENNLWAFRRIPHLLGLPDSVAVRFLSCEPLLGPVDLGLPENHAGHARDVAWDGWGYQCLDCGTEDEEVAWLVPSGPQIGWVIAGGESGGAKRREMNPAWLAGIVSQCQKARVPVFVKQDSGPKSGLQGRIPDDVWALKQFPGEVPASA